MRLLRVKKTCYNGRMCHLIMCDSKRRKHIEAFTSFKAFFFFDFFLLENVKNGRYPFSENGDIRSLLSVQN